MHIMDSETSAIPLGLYPGAVVWYFPFFWGGRLWEAKLSFLHYYEHPFQNISLFCLTILQNRTIKTDKYTSQLLGHLPKNTSYLCLVCPCGTCR